MRQQYDIEMATAGPIFMVFLQTYLRRIHMHHYEKIAETILSTAIDRGAEKSTCPSEIARKLFPDDWRKYMKDVLGVAIDLHKKGSVMITQKGVPVDVHDIKGPIRIRI
ncbi:DUF3253 domain-containing protein [Dyadobacter sp. CY351]|uniref:DUF3253 domain-containing protein n=1 Tax=Dyadobacter sp. CY351 TaxID=2909337 RepID=UPI001F3FE326|nr:DUF3253 domain-containing protein [Dyadobacter sp. CY351]MCF2517690.1 DUF3253 domain-containing protein [Dyadobacter sp. CY351]